MVGPVSGAVGGRSVCFLIVVVLLMRASYRRGGRRRSFFGGRVALLRGGPQLCLSGVSSARIAGLGGSGRTARFLLISLTGRCVGGCCPRGKLLRGDVRVFAGGGLVRRRLRSLLFLTGACGGRGGLGVRIRTVRGTVSVTDRVRSGR